MNTALSINILQRAPARMSGAALLVMVNFLSFSGTAFAATSPSQVPLFTAVAGATPNLMLILDNSGSMGFEFQEGYEVDNSCKDGVGNNCNSKKICPTGYTSNTSINGTNPVLYVASLNKGQYKCNNSSGTSVVITPLDYYTAGWYQMRSTQINTQYYNPATTYLARVDANNTPLVNNLIFVDNQSSSKFTYTAPKGGYTWNDSNYTPTYTEYTGTAPATAKFTYVLCADQACANRTVVDLDSTLSGVVTLPSTHSRTDCGPVAMTCPASQEMRNILNWYKWYRNRVSAVTTAMGQALQGYENKFRIGYGQFNKINANSYNSATSIERGVRYFRDDSSTKQWKSDFYKWIYQDVIAAGGTPSHQAYSLAAKYYRRTNDTSKGNPWKNDPEQTDAESASQDLSCRRAYTILFSDGAWSTDSGTNLPGDKYTSKTGTNFSGNPNGNPATLQYKPQGANGYNSGDLSTRVTARNMYIPYSDGGNKGYNGLADLAANYFWNTDFSLILDNNVPSIPGQYNPTFWQNMTTFTIGWGLTPTGERTDITGGKLTWQQINDYRSAWLTGATSYTQPDWSDGKTVDLNTGSGGGTYPELRVNDFIRAGFAGGGKAYSVYSGDDVRRALNDALSSMVGSGNDAGVAVSGNSGEFQTLNGQLKYTTEYQTADNTGDIKSFKLNANGGYAAVDSSGRPIPQWSANAKMPAVNNRKIFALSSYDASSPSTSASLRQELNYNTKLSALPSDFIPLLNADSKQKTDESFVRYMLGQDAGPTNVDGMPYRMRPLPIGASVNSAPAFVGGRVDMGYGDHGSVDGKADYPTYLSNKKNLPATIFSATNDGKVHVLNAAKTDTEVTVSGVAVPAGTELASFMPKGAMARQIDLANPAYHFSYVLDGPVVEDDIYASAAGSLPGTAASAGWQQLVFGTGGRGGTFMYGLRSPMNTADRVPTKDDFLWQLDANTSGYGAMSFITNSPTSGQLDDGSWVVLTSSGHYAGAGKQVGLYVVNALTGKQKAFIALPTSYNNTATAMKNRGLGGVVAVRDTNRKIVAAYAGDANGNLWRFDLRSSKFTVSYNRPVFTTPGGSAQPIYAAPTWQAHPGDGGATCAFSATTQCGAIVVVGTGILLDEDDLAAPANRQAIYGIWDKTPIGGDDVGSATQVTVGDLVEQTIDLASVKAGTGTEGTNRSFYQVSTNSVNWTTKKGWMLKLGVITYPGVMTNGERVVGDLANLGSSVQIASFLPADKNMTIESCTASSSLPNNVYLVDALTGKNKYSFDQNSDGVADFYSIVSISSGGFTRGNMTSSNAIGKVNEGDVELKPKADCTNEIGYYTGVGGTVKGFDACPAQSWRRSWRQVVSPPF